MLRAGLRDAQREALESSRARRLGRRPLIENVLVHGHRQWVSLPDSYAAHWVLLPYRNSCVHRDLRWPVGASAISLCLGGPVDHLRLSSGVAGAGARGVRAHGHSKVPAANNTCHSCSVVVQQTTSVPLFITWGLSRASRVKCATLSERAWVALYIIMPLLVPARHK
ncbi:hypothetical protein NDU88_006017 [Pleurodeles waltl]|uniref:Uncharacterized protein n=1 Tax=Pleurodeles waltl TaxID=8319 RepID=A0AAV7PHF0_PLEWA|nr:hypothetical protein NDU88_006017 [Pleurodeles waltl]